MNITMEYAASMFRVEGTSVCRVRFVFAHL